MSGRDSLSTVAMTTEFWTKPGQTVAGLRRKHGDIFRLVHSETASFVCATGLDAHKSLLVENFNKMSHYEGWRRVSARFAKIGRGIIFQDGPEHRWFRKVMLPSFSPSMVERQIPLMHEVVRRRLSQWPQDGVIGLFEEISAITFEIAAGYILGETAPERIDELHRLYCDVTSPSPNSPSIENVSAQLAIALHPIIRSRMQNPGDDVLSRVIVAGGPDGRALSEVELAAQGNTLMVAGHFTSAALCTKLLTMVCPDLRHMARLLEEQTAASADTLDDLAKMPLLNSTITETERWLSPVPHLVRRVKEEFEFRGYRIRPGEYALCSVAGTHMDESLFPDAERFDPERFAPPRNERGPHPLALAAFSVGPRRCLGAVLSGAVVKIIVHHMVRGFSLTLEAGANVVWLSLPVSQPRGRIPVRVSARHRA